MKFETQQQEQAAHTDTVRAIDDTDECLRRLLANAAYSDEPVQALIQIVQAIGFIEGAAREIDREV